MTTKFIITLSTLGLVTHLLFNPTLAEETTPPTPNPQPSATEKPATDTTAKPAAQEKSPATNKLAPGSVKNPELEAAVKGYIEAWQKKDFKTMRNYENWDEGTTLDEIGYIKALDTDFQIHTWKITQIKPEADTNNEFKVLVLIAHTPPKEVAAFIPAGQTVRSTLNQWWRKDGDKYVHLFNIERRNLLRYNAPGAVPPTDNNKKDNNAKPAEKTKAE